jgi:uncharacterized protein (TIGR02588 family)
MAHRPEGEPQRNPQTATKWEWILGALGGLLTLGTVGFLGWEAVAQPGDALPALSVEVDSIAPQGERWVVQVRARNGGHATAASVRIVGELVSDTGVVETSDVVLDYVPERSERRGALIFTRDPARYRLELRPAGYARP